MDKCLKGTYIPVGRVLHGTFPRETHMRSAFGRVIDLRGNGCGWIDEPRIMVPRRDEAA